MKRKAIFFLMVLLIVLTLLIHGATNGQQALGQWGLGLLALHVVVDWLIPALRRPPVEREANEGRVAYRHS